MYKSTPHNYTFTPHVSNALQGHPSAYTNFTMTPFHILKHSSCFPNISFKKNYFKKKRVLTAPDSTRAV